MTRDGKAAAEQQICGSRRPAWLLLGLGVGPAQGVDHVVGLHVEHGRVVRHRDGVLLGQGLVLSSKTELGFLSRKLTSVLT